MTEEPMESVREILTERYSDEQSEADDCGSVGERAGQ